MSLFGLKKTRDGLLGRMASLFGRRLDEEFYEELEEALILADVGVETSVELVDRLRCEVKTRKITDTKQAREVMVELVAEMMDKGTPEFTYPLLILTVGVNGVGKTTAIGRLANQFHLEGKKVLLAASLCEQAHLHVWDEPLNYIDVISRIQIEELLLRFRPTIVFVEHDKAFCENVATR